MIFFENRFTLFRITLRGKGSMGKILAAGVVLLLGAAPLSAEEFQWCVKLDAFTRNCAFAKYDDCVATANNANSPATGVGQCVRNPNYQPSAVAVTHVKPAPAKTASPQPANPQR
jgi:hypothetical protein